MDMIKLLFNLKLHQSSEMWHRIVLYVGINILEEPDTSTIQGTRMITYLNDGGSYSEMLVFIC
jgi:hypothetical protein